MISIKTAVTAAAIALVAAVSASPASAAVISNPVNNYSFPYLGSGQGGQQTQFIGQTFTASATGALTDFQFTLNSSTIGSMYGAVYAWDGSKPTTLLWQSPVISGIGAGANGSGLLDFSPVGVNVAQGQSYVAFLSTYGLASNASIATIGSCLSYSGCNDVNSNPNIGSLVWSTIYSDTVPLPTSGQTQTNWSSAGYLDTTFSVTIASPVPEPSTWAMMILGFGGVGFMAYRRRNQMIRFA